MLCEIITLLLFMNTVGFYENTKIILSRAFELVTSYKRDDEKPYLPSNKSVVLHEKSTSPTFKKPHECTKNFSFSTIFFFFSFESSTVFFFLIVAFFS